MKPIEKAFLLASLSLLLLTVLAWSQLPYPSPSEVAPDRDLRSTDEVHTVTV